MRIYSHWAQHQVTLKHPKGQAYDLTIRRGSDSSESHAQQLAADAAKDLRQRVGFKGETLDWYQYAQRSKPEPIIDEIIDESGERAAAVTINTVGCQVLNTQTLAFVDVDIPKPTRKTTHRFGLFKKKVQPDPTAEYLELLHDWIRESPSRGVRAYRTAGGLRYAITNPAMDPTSDLTRALLDQLRADPRYTTLCKHQECFRARLTPKPWRLNLGVPNRKLTREALNEGDPDIDNWLSQYAAESESHAVCHLIEELGDINPATPSTIRILELHDALTGVGTNRPLA